MVDRAPICVFEQLWICRMNSTNISLPLSLQDSSFTESQSLAPRSTACCWVITVACGFRRWCTVSHKGWFRGEATLLKPDPGGTTASGARWTPNQSGLCKAMSSPPLPMAPTSLTDSLWNVHSLPKVIKIQCHGQLFRSYRAAVSTEKGVSADCLFCVLMPPI